jgi:flagellar motor switch protein FliM
VRSQAEQEENVRPLDLLARETHSEAALSAMDRIANAFARGARRSMPFLLRYRAKVTPAPVEYVKKSRTLFGPEDVLSYSTFVGGPDLTAWAGVGLDEGAIGLVLDGALGGRGGGAPPQLGPALTSAQRALVSRIVGSLAGDLAAACSEELRMAFSAERGKKPVPNGDPFPSALCVRCSIEGAPIPATVTVVASAETLENVARQQQSAADVASDPRIGDVVPEVPLDVVAELGRVMLGLRHVLSLQVGDVVRLKTAADDPVLVRVGGLAKFSAVPVTSRGQIAVEIKGRHGE